MTFSKQEVAFHLRINPAYLTENRNSGDPFNFSVDVNIMSEHDDVWGETYYLSPSCDRLFWWWVDGWGSPANWCWSRPQNFTLQERNLFRQAFFETDLPETLVALCCYESSGVSPLLLFIGGTNEGRSKLVSRGVGSCLATTALQNRSSWAKKPLGADATYWMLCLRDIVYHLDEEDISRELILGLLSLPKRYPHCQEYTPYDGTPYGPRFRELYGIISMGFDILERLALRGFSLQKTFRMDADYNALDEFISDRKAWVRRNFEKNSDSIPCFVNWGFASDLSLIAALSLIDDRMLQSEITIIDPDHVRALRNYVSDDLNLNRTNMIIQAKNARTESIDTAPFDLDGGDSGSPIIDWNTNDPGESLYMYLGMCNNKAADIRFIGVLHLWIQIKAVVNFVDVEFGPFQNKTPSANAYKRQASLALGMPLYDLDLGPHAVFATSLIRLTNDPDPDVRYFGKAVCKCIPISIQQQAKWFPEVHRWFPPGVKAMVESMLKLAKRNDDGIPINKEILLRVVFPFACDALEQPLMYDSDDSSGKRSDPSGKASNDSSDDSSDSWHSDPDDDDFEHNGPVGFESDDMDG